MRKIIVRLLFLAVLTLGPAVSSALQDGGGPVPTCNPFTQNCSQ
jgi:hypothetical protein